MSDTLFSVIAVGFVILAFVGLGMLDRRRKEENEDSFLGEEPKFEPQTERAGSTFLPKRFDKPGVRLILALLISVAVLYMAILTVRNPDNPLSWVFIGVIILAVGYATISGKIITWRSRWELLASFFRKKE